MDKKSRPVGIIIISVLLFIEGVLGLGANIAAFFLVQVLASDFKRLSEDPNAIVASSSFGSGNIAILLLSLLSVLIIVASVGVWEMKKWGRILTTILILAGFIYGLFYNSLLTIEGVLFLIIDTGILYLMWAKKEIKSVFT